MPPGFERKRVPYTRDEYVNVPRQPTDKEIAEMKAERERGLDLTIRNSAVQLAIQAIGAGPHANDHLGDASLVEIAEDLYSFLKGTN